MQFYDSTRPALIPAGAHAALYYDGDYAATPAQAARFAAVRWITVTGDFAHCGIADYEPGNPVYEQPGALRAWAAGRAGMRKRARVYSDLASAARAAAQLASVPYEWWVATRGTEPVTAAQLAAMLASCGVAVPVAPVWAGQWAGGIAADYDTSALCGAW